jgi:hypothetical protein
MNIYEAITSIMNEGYAIAKEKRNAQQGFMYRGIDDVMNTFQPLMAKYKIFVVPEVLEHTREERTTGKGSTLLYSLLRVKYTFYADDGTSVSAVVIGEGMDSGDKASNKAMAVAMKYAMFQTFCIPTEDMADPDSETPPPSMPKGAAPKSAQEPDLIPAPPPTVCEECGIIIKSIKKKDGNMWPASDMVRYSKKRYGKALCAVHMQKAEEKLKAEEAAKVAEMNARPQT